jgi:hypothetical protein
MTQYSHRGRVLSRRAFIKLAGTATVGLLSTRCQLLPPGAVQPKEILSMWSVGDYLFQWWADGLRAPDKIFNIQSNYYGFSFDFHKFKLRKFGPVENPPSEPEALRQDNSLVESLPDMSIHASISRQGKASLVWAPGVPLKIAS